MKSVTGICSTMLTSLLLLAVPFGFEGSWPAFGPHSILARDLSHNRSSNPPPAAAVSSSLPEALLGRNISAEEAPPPPSSDNLYYDYEDALEEESGGGGSGGRNDGNSNSHVTPPDVIYPNPDRIARKKVAEERSRNGVAEAQEIKSANFVLRGISTNSQTGGNGAGGGGGRSRAGEAGGGNHDNNDELNSNNRVLARPNEAVDYELVEALDQDFKGHDLIDSIMYIYYGANSGSALGKEVGGNIIVIGAVVALAAQLLTLIILFMKNRQNRRHKNTLFPVLSALLIMTFLANFLFIIGVQSSRNVLKCEIIAILLHYLHLSTTFWVFLYIFCVYEFIKNNVAPNLNFLLAMGLGMPGFYIIFNYMISTSNYYEVTNYCFLSVKKGMIFNYMIPISFFIVATATYGTLCLRLLRIKQRQQFTESIESFIEHSRSEQMLNQIRQIGPDCPQQQPLHNHCGMEAQQQHRNHHGGSHRRLARCHSNPSSTTLKKSTAHLRGVNLTTSSINLTSTSMSPTKEIPCPIQESIPCCMGQNHLSNPNINHQQMIHPPPHCLDMMGTSKSICGDSKYSLGSISLANLSIQSLSSETEDFEDFKSAVKFAILFQIMFSICWFLAVIALEYPTSMMPIIYVIVLNIVNWIVLAKCHAICPVMIVGPLGGITATESHTQSFSKKSVKSNKSHSDHHNNQHNSANEKCNGLTVMKGRNGSVIRASGGGDEKIPLDDQLTAAAAMKKRESVSRMDTIPLLAKSAGLRTDHIVANGTIIDNDGMEEPEPTATKTAIPLLSQPLSNGGTHLNISEEATNRPEFISTIST